MGRIGGLLGLSPNGFVLLLGLAFILVPRATHAWSKEGHIMTCQIAQALLEPEAKEAVQNLLPSRVNGDLSALCTWPDQIRHWYKYRWTSPLHFIDTPDNECTFDYSRDCRDQRGVEDMCVAGAIKNFTSQLLHYQDGTSDRQYNLTEALLFLSHFMGDIHQPMHCGFTSDLGGNTVALRWFKRKSNLHHVWDSDIIREAAKQFYDKDMDLLQEDIVANYTHGVWSDDISSYASESINIACKWGYKDVEADDTLGDDYFNSRMPIVMKRIAQGGVRLAMILNRVFADNEEEMATPT
ncbi:hypothetical protein L1049_010361 [Liquidambar formosana]|uniref:Aspergillus nuclease S1 n=1 Tax=Liquidambar formosana TaxID=63359 RepID=A0AAP0NAY2_LIQFO